MGVTAFAEALSAKGLGDRLLTPQPKVSLSFALNDFGLVEVVKAEASAEELLLEPPSPPLATAEEPAEASGEGGGDAEPAAAAPPATGDEVPSDGADPVEPTPAAGEASKKKGEADTKKTKPAGKEKKAKAGKVPTAASEEVVEEGGVRKRIHRVQLSVAQVLPEGSRLRARSPEALGLISASLNDMDRADGLRREREAAKSDLEALMFGVRNWLSDEESVIERVTNEQQRDAISVQLRALEEWLEDGDGGDASTAEYRSKWSELATLRDAVVERVTEMGKRPEAVRTARLALADILSLAGAWPVERPQIEASEVEEVEERVNTLLDWLDDQEAAQAAAPAHEAPVFTSASVLAKMKPLVNRVEKLLK
jgi:hypothetical protein